MLSAGAGHGHLPTAAASESFADLIQEQFYGTDAGDTGDRTVRLKLVSTVAAGTPRRGLRVRPGK